MTEQELRAMVRESIARRPGGDAGHQNTVRLPDDSPHATAAFLRLPLRSGDEEGACLIEPAVRCNHCGYCLSMGH